MLCPLQLLLWCQVYQIAFAQDLIEQPTVTLGNGVVLGTATAIPNNLNGRPLVNSFLGIPFAQSPPIRFAPPQPPLPWTTPLEAKIFKPACMQQYIGAQGGPLQNNFKKVFGSYGGPMPAESEDCLYLNVYAPQNASSWNLKPVMFWIFPGNLMFGTASLDAYNGGSLAANHDVIVVTINYRTNVFGFSSSPELPIGSQNAGFLDQRLALQWVQHNIASFGGDPGKVMLFGESAGGYSVKQLLANPPKPLPFAAAVIQSQQASHGVSNRLSWERAVFHFRCQDRISPMRCLQQVPAKKLKAFIETHFVTFSPVQEDGTSTADVRKSIDAGTFAKVPTMIGTTANEFRAFEGIVGLENMNALISFLGGWFQIDIGNNLVGKALADIMNQPVRERYHLLDRFFTDLSFTCPSGAIAKYLSAKGHDAWRYHFSGVFPNMALFATHPEQGSYHTAEIPFVFGTYGPDSSPEQIILSKKMQSIWAGMAKDSHAGPGWPTAGGGVLAEIGDEHGSTFFETRNDTEIDQLCNILQPLTEITGLAW